MNPVNWRVVISTCIRASWPLLGCQPELLWGKQYSCRDGKLEYYLARSKLGKCSDFRTEHLGRPQDRKGDGWHIRGEKGRSAQSNLKRWCTGAGSYRHLWELGLIPCGVGNHWKVHIYRSWGTMFLQVQFGCVGTWKDPRWKRERN